MLPFALFAPVGLLMFALGWPLYRGKIKQNAWYGVRMSLTLENEEAWDVLNRRGGKGLVAVGLVCFAVSLVLLVLNVPELSAVLANLITLVGGTITLCVDLLRAVNRWPKR